MVGVCSLKKRLSLQIIRFVILLVVSWVAMTFTHELGHLIGGWSCGATLQAANLWPWQLPYSLLDPDPLPLVTLWSGPLLGVFIPCVIATSVARPEAWFVANFCTLANGLYLATGWISGDRFLDTQSLFEHGASPWSICIFCCLSIGFGYVRFRRSCWDAICPSIN